MTSPQWAAVDDDTADLLTLVAAGPLYGDDAEDRFLAACRADAVEHGGIVSINRVRERLTNHHGLTIEPRRLSALWSKHTGHGRAMTYTGEWELLADTHSGNDGKPARTRRWVGAA